MEVDPDGGQVTAWAAEPVEKKKKDEEEEENKTKRRRRRILRW